MASKTSNKRASLLQCGFTQFYQVGDAPLPSPNNYEDKDVYIGAERFLDGSFANATITSNSEQINASTTAEGAAFVVNSIATNAANICIDMEKANGAVSKEEIAGADKDGQVKSWLPKIGKLDYYLSVLKRGYDELDIIKIMSEHDLANIGVKKPGHIKKFLKEIGLLSAAASVTTVRTTRKKI